MSSGRKRDFDSNPNHPKAHVALQGAKKRTTRRPCSMATTSVEGGTMRVVVDDSSHRPGVGVRETTIVIPAAGTISRVSDALRQELRSRGASEQAISDAAKSYEYAALLETLENFAELPRAVQDKTLASLRGMGPPGMRLAHTLEAMRH